MVAAGVAPESTVPAAAAVPVAVLETSTASAPDTADSPEYSSAAIPVSAALDVFTVMVGLVPPPTAMGAVQTLSSVASEATKCSTSV